MFECNPLWSLQPVVLVTKEEEEEELKQEKSNWEV